jgi:hypothetical protein
MADAKPGETTSTPAAPAPAPAPTPAPAPHVQAIRAAVADLEKLAVEASGRGDQAMVERLREIAVPLDRART